MDPEVTKKRTRPSTAGTLSRTEAPLDPQVSPGIADDRLASWKEIAAFLKRDQRTVMRWETRGMPVRRIPGGKRSRVYASRAEISRWLSEHPESALVAAAAIPQEPSVQDGRPDIAPFSGLRAKFSKNSLISGVVVFLGLLAVVLITSRLSRPGVPTRIRFAERAVQALDEEGRRLWTYTFARPFDPLALAPTKRGLADFTRVVDLRGDGEREVLIVAPFRSGPNPIDQRTMEVDCFSSQGVLLWSYIPQDSYKFGAHDLKGPWNIFDVMVSHGGGKRSVWVAADHRKWGNSIVIQLDPVTGRGPVRFVNTGVLDALSELRTPNKTFLLAAGFNNEYETGTLAVIDESTPFAASPQTAGTRHQCTGCPTGDPDYYFVFPRSEINSLDKTWLDAIRLNAVQGGDIELSKHELDRRIGVETIYLLRLEPAVHVVSLRYSSEYDMEHRELERTHKITHSLAECPERLHTAPVRMWRPSAGWSELTVKPAGFAQ